ncbi:hypothetical protein BU16DRAFT_559387 [Lophium mytilinum]|uniref:C3H1-type domain-containing protein n=1 Tax=Lophium mytilinum TaxID=390894 RepID=A0A6A6R138_9PEZI|nr:hypothetical protein BU16DRAFT_559387 [Lophium mytilinum]
MSNRFSPPGRGSKRLRHTNSTADIDDRDLDYGRLSRPSSVDSFKPRSEPLLSREWSAPSALESLVEQEDSYEIEDMSSQELHAAPRSHGQAESGTMPYDHDELASTGLTNEEYQNPSTPTALSPQHQNTFAPATASPGYPIAMMGMSPNVSHRRYTSQEKAATPVIQHRQPAYWSGYRQPTHPYPSQPPPIAVQHGFRLPFQTPQPTHPDDPSLPKNFNFQPLTCFFWKTRAHGCKFTAGECQFAHWDTGALAPAPKDFDLGLSKRELKKERPAIANRRGGDEEQRKKRPPFRVPSGNNLLTKPVLTKPVLTKPVLTKPVLTKPVLTKPVLTKPSLDAPSPNSPYAHSTQQPHPHTPNPHHPLQQPQPFSGGPGVGVGGGVAAYQHARGYQVPYQQHLNSPPYGYGGGLQSPYLSPRQQAHRRPHQPSPFSPFHTPYSSPPQNPPLPPGAPQGPQQQRRQKLPPAEEALAGRERAIEEKERQLRMWETRLRQWEEGLCERERRM